MKLRKALAFVLVLVMLLGVLPLTAFAADQTSETAAQDQNAQTEDEKTGITGVSLAIDSDLAIRYYVNVDDAVLADGKEMYIKIGGDTITSYTEKDGAYVFTYDGIGPHQIDAVLTAKLFVGDELSDENVYSIEEYCRELLVNEEYNTSAKLVQLVNDLLIYAKAAEAYKDNTQEIAKDMTLTASEYAPSESDSVMVDTNLGDETVYVRSAGVKFDSSNRIYFKIYSKDAAPIASINGVPCSAELAEGEENTYIVYSAPISSVDFADAYILTVDGTDIHVSYSVNTYAYRIQDNTDTKVTDLATALYRFGKSCEEYVVPVITYVTNEGILDSAVPLVYDNVNGTVLPTPTRSGYKFAGWYTTEAFEEGTLVGSVGKGAKGEITVYAKWTKYILNADYTNSDTYYTSGGTAATIKTDAYGNDYGYVTATEKTNNYNNKDFSTNLDAELFEASGYKLTFSVDLMKVAHDTYTSKTVCRLRVGTSTDVIVLFRTTNAGEVIFHKTTETSIGTLTTDAFTKFAFTIDLDPDNNNGTITAYDVNGNKLAEPTTITTPAVSTTIADLLTWVQSAYINWQFADGSKVLACDNFEIYYGDYVPSLVYIPEGYTNELTYNTVGGTLNCTPEKYVNAGDALPTAADFADDRPDGIEFEGWYTNLDYTGSPVTTVPAGAPEQFTVYAKWTSLTIFEEDFENVPSAALDSSGNANIGDVEFRINGKTDVEVKTLTVGEDEDKNTYIQFTRGSSDPAASSKQSLKDLLAYSGGKITYQIDLAGIVIPATEDTEESVEYGSIAFRMRAKEGSDTKNLTIFTTTTGGKVKIGSQEIATLSAELQTITVTLDTIAGTVTAYNLDGTVIASVSVSSPISSLTLYEYALSNTYLFDMYFDESTGGTGLCFDNVNVTLGGYTPAANS